MTTRTLSAGDIIDARCTRCRKVMNHRIIAMVEGKVVRVECNTCGGAHNYHPPEKPKAASTTAGSRKPAAPARTSSKKDPAAAERAEWASLRPTMNTERATAYDMSGSYRVNNLVEHPTFGLGVVKRLVPTSKIEVLFEAGIKLLRCK